MKGAWALGGGDRGLSAERPGKGPAITAVWGAGAAAVEVEPSTRGSQQWRFGGACLQAQVTSLRLRESVVPCDDPECGKPPAEGTEAQGGQWRPGPRRHCCVPFKLGVLHLGAHFSQAVF